MSDDPITSFEDAMADDTDAPQYDDGEFDDDFCSECGDEFHYDDCGGYNPPCSCGFHCRSCHEAVEGRHDPDDDYPEDPGQGDLLESAA